MHYELRQPRKIIDSDLYCQELTGSQQAIDKSQPGTMLDYKSL